MAENRFTVGPNPGVDWIGISGKKYFYQIEMLPFSCHESFVGNYILAKLMDGKYYPVYIGEGVLDDRINDDDHFRCATAKGATLVFLHLNSLEENRKREERDLLAGNPESYAPIGCNQTRHG